MGVAMAFLQHLRESNLSPTTINAYRNTLKSLYHWAKIGPENPFKDVHKLREYRKSYRYFSEWQQQELAAVIPAYNKELWMACQFQYYLLLRPNELRLIRCGDFDLDNKRLMVPGSFSKNSIRMPVIIPDNFMPIAENLRNYPPHFHVFSDKGCPGVRTHGEDYFSEKHQEILKRRKYNLDEYKFYSWKHTGAVMFYLATGDIKALKEQGRWHSLDMVNQYLKNLGVLEIERLRSSYPTIGSAMQVPSGIQISRA
jgi:integrase